MKIEYRTGDLLQSRIGVMIHGCNSQGRMGRGIGQVFKERLPWVYTGYQRAYAEALEQIPEPDREQNPQPTVIQHWTPPALPLGTVVWSFRPEVSVGPHGIDTPLIVGNAITQKYWPPQMAVDGRNVDYVAVKNCLQEIDHFVSVISVEEVGMPMLGAGLAGGDWDTIAAIIEAESHNFKPVVYQL